MATAEIRGLIAHWKMNSPAGSTELVDSAGDAHGTIDLNFANFVAGRVDNALEFNGTAGIGELPGECTTTAELDKLGGETNQYTISLWVKTPSQQAVYARIFEKPATPYPVVVRMGPDDRIHLALWDGTRNPACKASTAITYDTWTHYLWTIDRVNKVMKIYVNGVLDVTSTDTTTGDISNTSNIIWGNVRSGLDRRFIGTVDDVRIYNRILDDDEIEGVYSDNLEANTYWYDKKQKTPYAGEYAKSKWGKIFKKRKTLRKAIEIGVSA